jgi:anaerobic selenocysteine-containing dehydrogenase
MEQSRDSIKDIWGERTPYWEQWPIRMDQRIEVEPDKWVQSACVLCSNGCGLDIGVKNGRIIGVRGRAADAVNKGRLGPKGLHGWEANNSPDRLSKPMIRRNGKLEEASWDEAMDLIVQKSKDIIQMHTALAIGFYTSGQLFLEEYYALAVIGKAGIGTPHMDGNTRLCTATAAAALKVSFGSDGQPGSYTDLDTAETILHCGHNIASQQTVLWMRILDRLAGPNPPTVIAIDPRNTFTAQKATIHLAPKAGTNLAVMNGLLHLIIKNGAIDQQYIDAHTTGFEELKKVVSQYTPEKVEAITGVPAHLLNEAGHILSTTKTLVSTVLQGFYQSMQATAAAVQVNNIHLIRGLIGKDGCGIYQMNGQPTAQNTRETGADGDLPGFRNWGNEEHIKQLADLWNIDPIIIPHWAPPTHAMQIWRYAEQGSIKLLWISATNPAVSLPDLPRIRKILEKEDLFVIVQDGFLTETASYADVVLPAALWGEKTGTFTNVDRTVHISHKAVDPPGEAHSDLDIFLDYARRMQFKDKDGAPLIKWRTPEEVFEGWKDCSRGRPCDYTGLTYAKLSEGSGIQWPCNEQHPNGTKHIYTDGVFNTGLEYCETYGHDLDTGATVTMEEYKSINPGGKAFIKAAAFRPPHETPDNAYPLMLTTGRVVYHFHTRTKTGRSAALNNAAPNAFVQISERDATNYGITEGDMVELSSRRGKVVVAANIGGIIEGHVFMPFHYGCWDDATRNSAANELTLTEWDPVSKQPHFKYAAVRIQKADKTIMDKIGDAIESVKDKLKPQEA